MIESMLQSPAQWLDGMGNDPEIVLSTQCRLVRNLTDFPFPRQCAPDEKKSIETNILGVMSSMNWLSGGQYYSLPEIDELEAQALSERKLISSGLISAMGARGVYVREDQSFSLSINDSDHLVLVGLGSGQQLQEVWNQISLADDTLAGILDFAFDKKRGFLTSHLSDTGTGLKLSAVLHLPGMTMKNSIAHFLQLSDDGFQVTPEYLSGSSASGDLYRISSTGALGQAEMEMTYHFVQAIDALIMLEREAQKDFIEGKSVQLDDRIERALGLARSARLLAFDEALGVLSSLRLGVTCGLLKGYALGTLNEIGIIAQNAHLQLSLTDACDDNNCSMQRAHLFRERFAENP